MEKYDVKKALKPLYTATARDFTLVDVPPAQYLAVDGHGNPNTAASYVQAVEALYAVSYSVKFHSKKELGRDYVVAPLEGLWSAEDTGAFTAGDKDSWDWTMMLGVPEWITAETVAAVAGQVAAKKDVPALPLVRVETLSEGLCVQILHIGPYSGEGLVLAKLHGEFMPANSLDFNGRHHEIYLSDPRRAAPEKLKTILRQPVKPAVGVASPVGGAAVFGTAKE